MKILPDDPKDPVAQRWYRFGYFAKGVIYLIIGGMAVLLTVNSSGDAMGAKGSLRVIADQPFGTALLLILAAMLLGYVGWKMVQAWTDAEGKGKDWKGIVTRVGYGGSGLIHLGLAASATMLAVGQSGSGSDSKAGLAQYAFSWPGGRWLVGAAGVIFLLVAFRQLQRAYKASFMKSYSVGSMSSSFRSSLEWIGRIGLTSRGAIFSLVGGFLMYAAWMVDANQVVGTEGALEVIRSQAYGTFLLAAVAGGLAVYGIYCFSRAKYRSF